MIHIAAKQKFEHHGFILSNKAQTVCFVDRDVRSYVKQVKVERLPEPHNVFPRFSLVRLRTDPAFLLVFGKPDFAPELRPYESLVVVACRIDEVPEDFFL